MEIHSRWQFIFREDENVELILRPLSVDKRLDFRTKLFSTFVFLQLDNTVQNYSFEVVQEHEITDLKPAIIKVYDYYHPGKHIPSCSPFSSFFSPKNHAKALHHPFYALQSCFHPTLRAKISSWHP